MLSFRFAKSIPAAVLALSLVSLAGVAGPAAAKAHHKAAAHKAAAVAKYVKSNAHTHTATLTVIAASSSVNGGENFDGYSKGALTFVVPKGWKVIVKFSVAASAGIPHSFAVVTQKQKFTNFSPKPVFAGAASTNAMDGTAPGAHQTLHFTATKPGKYRVICAVPGHALLGMWDWLIVKPGLHAAKAVAK